MPSDPRLEIMGRASPDPVARLEQKVADLTKELEGLRRGGRRTFAGQGPPPHAAADGALYVDVDAHRLYVRSNGLWKYAGLT